MANLGFLIIFIDKNKKFKMQEIVFILKRFFLALELSILGNGTLED